MDGTTTLLLLRGLALAGTLVAVAFLVRLDVVVAFVAIFLAFASTVLFAAALLFAILFFAVVVLLFAPAVVVVVLSPIEIFLLLVITVITILATRSRMEKGSRTYLDLLRQSLITSSFLSGH